MDKSDLGELRHDLMNVVLALRSGCLLIETESSEPAVREILTEMRAELDKAIALLGRLRDRTPSHSSAKLGRE